MMLISLTGFMGCGKSSVGRELSKLLCCPFIDLDSVIEEGSGRSIPEIFAKDGEAEFRRMELETLQYVIGQFPMCSRGPLPLCGPHPHQADTPYPSVPVSAVVALGGGTVMTKECAGLVHEKTLCIYLRASIDTLVSHLEGESSGRPMLQGELRSRIESLMALRSSTYEKTAHVIIDTDGKPIETIVKDILLTQALRVRANL